MRLLKSLFHLIPHAVIAMSIVLLTLSITDHFNTAMEFINHPMTKVVLLLFALLTLVLCVTMVAKGIIYRSIPLTLLPIVPILLSVGMLVFLFLDLSDPKAIVFTKALTKQLLFADVVAALVQAVVTAVLHRMRLYRIYREAVGRKKKEREKVINK